VPELPEVETLRRGLAARITGMRITAVEVLDRKIFDGPGDAIKHDVVDHQISRVARCGKVLILFLREPGKGSGDSGSLLIHPKMTGQLVLTLDGATTFAGGHPTPSMLRPMPNPTIRAVFRLGPACCLYYDDARRFGWIRPAGPDPCRTDPFLARLGPDPLGADFTPAAMRQALARHPRAPSTRCCSTRPPSRASATSTPMRSCIVPASTPPGRRAVSQPGRGAPRALGDPGHPARGGWQRQDQLRR
jgi:formamidopyrimidine-DNA glycosylase